MITNMKICRMLKTLNIATQIRRTHACVPQLKAVTSYSCRWFRITKSDPNKKFDEENKQDIESRNSDQANVEEQQKTLNDNFKPPEEFRKASEDNDDYGYLPKRELTFNAKDELVLFSMKIDILRNKRKRQIPFVLGSTLFGYLVMSNLLVFNYHTAGFFTYLKLSCYWICGLTPSMYLLLVSQKASGRILTEMRLKKNGEEVYFKNLKGEEFIKKIKDLKPLIDERMLSLNASPKYKTVFYHFHSDGNHYMIDGLPKSNENIDIIQNIIHGIKIVVKQ